MNTLGRLYKSFRILPYVVLASIGLILFFLCQINKGFFHEVTVNLFSDTLFFFVAFLFFDAVQSLIRRRESKYLDNYIKNKISNDVFIALYFQKKFVHGYNLDTNTLDNIMGIINYPVEEIEHAISNQRYLGFQIFKDTDEVRSLFDDVLNDNLVLKYSTHLETINLLRIANNLSLLEVILKNEENFKNTHPRSSEFTVVNGRDINPANPERYLLLRKSARKDRFVVYDSGDFEKRHLDKLLNEYTLNRQAAERAATILHDTFILMRVWIPDVTKLRKNEKRFRIIKQFFSPATRLESGDSELYVADIIQTAKKH